MDEAMNVAVYVAVYTSVDVAVDTSVDASVDDAIDSRDQRRVHMSSEVQLVPQYDPPSCHLLPAP